MKSTSILNPLDPLINLLSWVAILASGGVLLAGIYASAWYASFGLVLVMTTAIIRVAFFGIESQSMISGEGAR